MKTIFFIIFFLIQHLIITAQSNFDGVAVITHYNLQNGFSSIDEMLTDKVFHRGIELKTVDNNSPYFVYASIKFEPSSNTSTLPQIGLKLSSGFGSLNNTEVILSEIPVKIISLHDANNLFNKVVFLDVIQHAFKQFIKPGDYKYSIKFSILN